jgi:ribose transport system permease protein
MTTSQDFTPGIGEAKTKAPNRLRALMGNTASWMLGIDVLLILVFGLISHDRLFLSLASFQNIGLNSAQIILLTCGITYELAAGQIDISLGAILVLSSVTSGEVIQKLGGTAAQVQAQRFPHLALALIFGIIVAIATGALCGLVNGLIVTRLRVHSFIATLATTGILTGIALIITNGADLGSQPTWFQQNFAGKLIWGIPLPVILVLVLLLGLWAVMKLTRFGLYTLALGSSETAAERSGIKVPSQKIKVFVLSGSLAGIAALLDLSRYGGTNISGHSLDALAAIAGAVIGGTSLYGGRASVPGALFGSLLAVILETGLIAVGLAPFYQVIAVGLVLIGAVYLDGRRRTARE